MTKMPEEFAITLSSTLPDVAIFGALPTEESNERLKHLRMPDEYYEQMIEKYDSDELRKALEEDKSGTELNEIVRRLGKEKNND
jgi:thiaminase